MHLRGPAAGEKMLPASVHSKLVTQPMPGLFSVCTSGFDIGALTLGGDIIVFFVKFEDTHLQLSKTA